MFPNDSITLFKEISGNTTFVMVSGTAPKTIIGVAMQQSKDLSDTVLLCGSNVLAKNYAKDLPQILMNYQCAQPITISKTGNDVSSISLTYVPYFTSDFATTTTENLGFNPTTTIASSTDIQVYGYFSAGDIVISVLLLCLILLKVLRDMASALSGIKTKRKVLQYGGGDVEIIDDK